MKANTAVVFTVAALLSGATAASAALFSSTPKPSDSLNLSSQEQMTAWNDLSRAVNSNPPSSFQPATSSAVPSTLNVRAIPAKTASDVPELKPYDYAKVPGELLIVNPRDMMIAEIITG